MRTQLLSPEPLEIPLRLDETGAWRVGHTRVLLDIVVYEFQRGSTPEQIVDAYDTLTIGDVYRVIAYYLSNREAVDKYIAEREAQAEQMWREFEVDFPNHALTKDKFLKKMADKSKS